MILTVFVGKREPTGSGIEITYVEEGVRRTRCSSAHAQLRGTVLKRFPLVHNLHLVRLQPGRSLEHAIAAYRLQPDANERLCLEGSISLVVNDTR
jgi:hypothetical protein